MVCVFVVNLEFLRSMKQKTQTGNKKVCVFWVILHFLCFLIEILQTNRFSVNNKKRRENYYHSVTFSCWTGLKADRRSAKKIIDAKKLCRYRFRAAAKSADGPRNPETFYGDTDTHQRVFLCLLSAHTQIMVAQVGLTSVGPVSVGAGIANPIWATTP